jgi:hypothetical protein
MNIPNLVAVQALQNYDLYVVFADGVEGKVNLTHLANKPAFKQWQFDDAHINPQTGAVAWNDNLDICPDNIYLKILKSDTTINQNKTTAQ